MFKSGKVGPVSELGPYEQAACEVLRALRGRRSQIAWARRLGYRSNPITDWEHGRRFPTAPETLRAARRANIDLARVFSAFHPSPAPTAETGWSVAAWLDSLRGSTNIADLTRLAGGYSRYSVSRWLAGTSTPRLPAFLQLLDAINGRAAEWVALLVPIDRVPTLEPTYRQMNTARRISVGLPWSEAVLRILETTSYTALRSHSDTFVAAQLAIGEDEVAEILYALCDAGVIERMSGSYRVIGSLVVDTKVEPEAATRLRRHWAKVALERVDASADNWFAYNVISASEKDLERIQRRLRAVFREIRLIVKESEPTERAALLTMQLSRW